MPDITAEDIAFHTRLARTKAVVFLLAVILPVIALLGNLALTLVDRPALPPVPVSHPPRTQARPRTPVPPPGRQPTPMPSGPQVGARLFAL